jgi:hypothetical protein
MMGEIIGKTPGLIQGNGPPRLAQNQRIILKQSFSIGISSVFLGTLKTVLASPISITDSTGLTL